MKTLEISILSNNNMKTHFKFRLQFGTLLMKMTAMITDLKITRSNINVYACLD